MAKAGNHGIIIPRDAALLRRLYWKENRTLPEIGALYGVTHKSVERVFRDLGIPRRGIGSSRIVLCIDCKTTPPFKRKHKSNGSLYGTRCRACHRRHYNKLAASYIKRPEVHAKREDYMARWYLNGATNPTGEAQWLTKGKHLLRNARRLCLSPQSHLACESRNAAFALARNLRT